MRIGPGLVFVSVLSAADLPLAFSTWSAVFQASAELKVPLQGHKSIKPFNYWGQDKLSLGLDCHLLYKWGNTNTIGLCNISMDIVKQEMFVINFFCQKKKKKLLY